MRRESRSNAKCRGSRWYRLDTTHIELPEKIMKITFWNTGMPRWFGFAAGIVLLPSVAWGLEKKLVLDTQTELTAEENKQSAATPNRGFSLRWIETDQQDTEKATNTARVGVSTCQSAADVAAQ